MADLESDVGLVISRQAPIEEPFGIMQVTWLSEVDDAASRIAANLLVSIETGLFDILSLLASSC